MKHISRWTATLSMWGRASAAFGRIDSRNRASAHAVQRVNLEKCGPSREEGMRRLLEQRVGQKADADTRPGRYDDQAERLGLED